MMPLGIIHEPLFALRKLLEESVTTFTGLNHFLRINPFTFANELAKIVPIKFSGTKTLKELPWVEMMFDVPAFYDHQGADKRSV